MYQIFVVEDELLIRQSIRNSVENMKGPFSFCGEASDGEMALSMMHDLMPDILLTDIRMPFLDGFGLIRHAKAMMPWLKIAIISGYDDFEYAQQAIELGVDQYLLKPVRQADLVRVVGQLAEKIEREKAASNDGAQDSDEVKLALRQHFMRQLLSGGAETGELLEKARKLGMDIVSPCYLVMVCSFDAPDYDRRALRLIAGRALADSGMPLYDFDPAGQLAVVGCGSEPEEINERMYSFASILRHELREVCPVVTSVISSETRRLGGIADAYKTAVNLLKMVSGVAAGQVINVGDTAQLAADIVSSSGPFDAQFRSRLSFASAEEVPALLDEALSAADGAFDSMLVRYNALIDLMKIAIDLTAKRAPEADPRDIAASLSRRFDILAAAGSREAFRSTAVQMLSEAVGARRESQGDIRYSHVIHRAEQYVRENYCDPNISLLSVSRHVGMSAAHFSTVFSQTTGRSFIAYLTALRIGRAKELLAGTDMRLSDIAMEIGYNEPNYFSHVFRKAEGITPKNYRQQERGQ